MAVPSWIQEGRLLQFTSDWPSFRTSAPPRTLICHTTRKLASDTRYGNKQSTTFEEQNTLASVLLYDISCVLGKAPGRQREYVCRRPGSTRSAVVGAEAYHVLHEQSSVTRQERHPNTKSLFFRAKGYAITIHGPQCLENEAMLNCPSC